MRFLSPAREELRRAVKHYEAETPGLGSELAAQVEHAVQQVAEFPMLGRPHPAGVRQVVIQRFPFSIIYSVREPEVVIIAVTHHRRRPGYWLKRM